MVCSSQQYDDTAPRDVRRPGQTGQVEILETLELASSSVVLRRAEASDLPAIVELIAADQLGATRDGVKTPEDLAAYQAAFEAIDRDPAHLLLVAQSGPDIVATMQLSFLPGLARRGALQLTTDKSRTTAHRFYERLGFVASHDGMKLSLQQSGRPSSGDGAADGPAA